MSKMIQIGDKVTIFYTNGDEEVAYVTHLPQGEGDTHQFENLAGCIFILNVYASTVERIEKEKVNDGQATT